MADYDPRPVRRPRAQRFGEVLGVELPSGTVTFLFTDIEGSVKLSQVFPEAAVHAVERHEHLLQQAVDDAGGFVFGRPGDGLCVAFTDAFDALQAAVTGQTALQAEDWGAFAPGFGPVRVRMGIHTGKAVLRRSNYYGGEVNRVARVTQLANGGQIVMTAATAALLRDRLPANLSLRDLGRYVLPELASAEHVYQVVSPGLRDITIPMRSETPDRPHVWVQVIEGRDDSTTARATTSEAASRDREIRTTMQLLHDALVHRRRVAALTGGQVRAVAEHKPVDLTEYRLTRAAQWSQPLSRLDERFVELSLLVDRGENDLNGRWAVQPMRYSNLGQVLSHEPSSTVVLLGPPGSGKTTILQHEELVAAVGGLCGETRLVPFFARLADYGMDGRRPVPKPREWLADQWSRRYPELLDILTLLEEGRALLLLDGLNEMPAVDAAGFRDRVSDWKSFLRETVAAVPGNRAVFSCRSLDYSAPLSSQALPVPQVRIEPMDDAAMLRMIRAYSPVHADEIWAAVRGSKLLEILRTPYMLRLLAAQVDAHGHIPDRRATLFSAYVQSALQREIEIDNPLFRPGRLLTERDYRRIVAVGALTIDRVTAERSPLLCCLGELAYRMQAAWPGNEMALVRVEFDRACDLAGSELGRDVIRAAGDLGVLAEDPIRDEVMFSHQLLQEYFAARRLQEAPEPELVRTAWRAKEVVPSLDETLSSIADADPLPPLPGTRWDETMSMTVAMAADPATLIDRLVDHNLVLAARCAAESTEPLPAELLDRLRRALVDRSRSREADLRARIAAGGALGALGDPRYDLVNGPNGPHLVPPMVPIEAGDYVVGSDDGLFDTEESPRHVVHVDGFRIGRFPVTNAEWSRFVAAGGYDNEEWWDTPDARAWRNGKDTAFGQRWSARHRRRQWLANPLALDAAHEQGALSRDDFELWLQLVALDGAALDERLAELFPGGRVTEPRYWRDQDLNGATQPVVGVCWFEARAYASWLSDQTGSPFRLPTEAEWEAAARGPEGRRYAYGDDFEQWRGNTVETHIRRTTPIGVFPDGDTPLGVADMTGSVFEWTSTLYGTEPDVPTFAHPYRPDDGRERAEAGADVQRIMKGGCYSYDHSLARAAVRLGVPPSNRTRLDGVRLVCD